MAGSLTIDISEEEEKVYEFTGFEVIKYPDNTYWFMNEEEYFEITNIIFEKKEGYEIVAVFSTTDTLSTFNFPVSEEDKEALASLWERKKD